MSIPTYRTVSLPNGDIGIEITEAGREPRIIAELTTMTEAESYIRLSIMMDTEAEKKIERDAKQ